MKLFRFFVSGCVVNGYDQRLHILFESNVHSSADEVHSENGISHEITASLSEVLDHNLQVRPPKANM